MAKRCRDPDFDGTKSSSGFKTVFVATSLDTHLAMRLSFSDTVADFKKKIMLQHEQCFPKTGALTVHSLKVKYQGKLYHLHESDMVVSNAFEGYEGRWSLFVDASNSLEVVNEQSALVPCDKGELESSSLPLATDAIARKSPGESSQYTRLEVGHVDGTLKSVENDLRSKENSKDQNEKLPSRNGYETRSRAGLNPKKKQKFIHSLHVAGESTLVATRTSPRTTTRGRSNNEAAGLEDSIVGAGPKVSTDVRLGGRDAGASPHNTMFSGTKTSEQSEPESRVVEKEAVHGHHSEDLSIRNQVSDMENKSLEKSVAELRENLASPDVPSQRLQEEQPAISASTKKKRKRKKQHQETNSFVPCDHAATSKPGTVLQESVLTEAFEGQILGSGNHGMVNDESLLTSTGNLQNNDNEAGRLSSNHEVGLSENVKPSDLVETTPAKKEIVICLGILDKSPEAVNSEVSKSKIRNSRKSAVRKLDQLDVEHDLSAQSTVFVTVEGAAPRAHIEDHSGRDENVLPQNGPKKSEENTELAKNNVPVAICFGGSYKHLDSDETNLNEKESASDIAFNVRDDPEGGKSGCTPKKKKTKKSASKYAYRVMGPTKDAIDPLALKDSHSEFIPGDVLADQSLFSSIDGMEKPKMVSPTNTQKNVNGNTASDNDDVHLPLSEVEHIQSINEDLDLNSGKESDIYQSQDRVTVQDQVITEHAKEAGCQMDQPDGEQKNKGTTMKRKKKAKRNGNSTGEGLGILEVNPENIGDEELASLASLVEKLCDVDDADTMKVNGSDEKRTIDQSGVSELGLGKNSDLKGTGKSEQLLQNSDGPEVPAHEIESNCEVRHATVVSRANHGLASEGGNGSVNFRRYFVPGDDHRGAASTDKVQGESNVVEGAEKADEQTIVPEGKRRPSKSWGNQKNSSGINTGDKSHEHSSSKAKQKKSASEIETSTNSRKRSKSLNSTRDANVRALKKSVDQAIINGSDSTVTVPRQLKENDGSLTSSNLNSVTRESNKMLLNKSSQKKQTGINLKNTAEGEISRKKVKDLEKGLLTTPGKIFGDVLSESSGDENGKLNSGPSIQIPSDSSSSSSSSSSSEDLMREGSINKGRKTALGSKLPDAKNMSMDTILRSSSRFKKAKLTASQSEADS